MNYDIMKLWLQRLALEWVNTTHFHDAGIQIYNLEYKETGLGRVELNAKLDLGNIKIALTYDGEPEDTQEIKAFITGENDHTGNKVDRIVFLPANSKNSSKKARKLLKKEIFTAITKLNSR